MLRESGGTTDCMFILGQIMCAHVANVSDLSKGLKMRAEKPHVLLHAEKYLPWILRESTG